MRAMKAYGMMDYNSTHSLPGHIMAALSLGKINGIKVDGLCVVITVLDGTNSRRVSSAFA